MLFTDPLFLFGFLPAVYGVWLILRSLGSPDAFVFSTIIAASILFYSWLDVSHVALLLGSIIFNWIISRHIASAPYVYAKMLTATAVAANLTLLCVYKYAGFFTGNAINLALPLGISFFTFQQISYVCDTLRYRSAEPRLIRYMFLITFFPHLIAGPIVRYSEVRPQFSNFLRGNLTLRRNIVVGLLLIVSGLAKKLLIADTLAPMADAYFTMPDSEFASARSGAAAVAMVAFYLQIYFDFSGYTDIAIGIARLFNIRFPNNFNFPYRACSVSDFWRRWHITLSRFLRDYLYVPLGGNRDGTWRRNRNLMITMALGGLWHGAAWNFIVWGVLHGAALVIYHAWSSWPGRPRLGWVAAWVLTQGFILLSWTMFRSPTLGAGFETLSALFAFDFRSDEILTAMVTAFYGGPIMNYLSMSNLGLIGPLAGFAIGMLFAVAKPSRSMLRWAIERPVLAIQIGAVLSCLDAIAIWLRMLQAGRADPFIYFQF